MSSVAHSWNKDSTTYQLIPPEQISQEPLLLEEINKLIREHGSGKNIFEYEKGHQIGELTANDFSQNNGTTFLRYYSMLARKEEQIIGVVTFRVDDQGRGELDKVVVKQSERRLSESKTATGEVALNLGMLALADLVLEHHCQEIYTNPGSEQGRRSAERGGFKRKTDDRGTLFHRFDLDERVIHAIHQQATSVQEVKIEQLQRTLPPPILKEISLEQRPEQEETRAFKIK